MCCECNCKLTKRIKAICKEYDVEFSETRLYYSIGLVKVYWHSDGNYISPNEIKYYSGYLSELNRSIAAASIVLSLLDNQ